MSEKVLRNTNIFGHEVLELLVLDPQLIMLTIRLKVFAVEFQTEQTIWICPLNVPKKRNTSNLYYGMGNY
jgi:hypothetical protein